MVSDALNLKENYSVVILLINITKYSNNSTKHCSQIWRLKIYATLSRTSSNKTHELNWEHSILETSICVDCQLAVVVENSEKVTFYVLEGTKPLYCPKGSGNVSRIAQTAQLGITRLSPSPSFPCSSRIYWRYPWCLLAFE